MKLDVKSDEFFVVVQLSVVIVETKIAQLSESSVNFSSNDLIRHSQPLTSPLLATEKMFLARIN
jgi:hypothetical protein